MNQPLPQMVLLLHSRRRTLVKKGLTRAQADVYVTALRERASCRASVSPEPRKSNAKAVPKAASAPPVRTAQPQPQPATSFDQPAFVGIEPDDNMFKAAESQRMAARALTISFALLLLVIVLRLKSPYLVSLVLAMNVLGAIAVFQLGQATGSSLFRLVLAPLALVPGVGSLLAAWSYFRAASVLKENGLITGNSLLDADEVRELGGREGMLPSTKLLIALLVLAAAGGYAFINFLP